MANQVIAGTGGQTIFFDVSPSDLSLATTTLITLKKPDGTTVDHAATVGVADIETDCQTLVADQYMFFVVVPTDFDAADAGDWEVFAQWDINSDTDLHKITSPDSIKVLAP